jgi:hypothetical protein
VAAVGPEVGELAAPLLLHLLILALTWRAEVGESAADMLKVFSKPKCLACPRRRRCLTAIALIRAAAHPLLFALLLGVPSLLLGRVGLAAGAVAALLLTLPVGSIQRAGREGRLFRALLWNAAFSIGRAYACAKLWLLSPPLFVAVFSASSAAVEVAAWRAALAVDRASRGGG